MSTTGQIMVVSLANSHDRRQKFATRNSHLDFQFVDAADGRVMKRDEIMATGLFDKDLDYKPGAFGVTISHCRLWDFANSENRAITICEDDAVLSLHFNSQSEQILDQLPPDWDVIYWGWNFDAVLALTISQNVPLVIKSSEAALRKNIDSLQKEKRNSVPVRMITAFGSLCYSVSPKGARRLRELMFPIRNEIVDIYGLGRIANHSKDISMAMNFRNMKAFVAFPPVAFSENLKNESTIWAPSED